jgi:hypothetical protein
VPIDVKSGSLNLLETSGIAVPLPLPLPTSHVIANFEGVPVANVTLMGLSALPLHSPDHDFCLFAATVIFMGSPYLMLLNPSTCQYSILKEGLI